MVTVRESGLYAHVGKNMPYTETLNTDKIQYQPNIREEHDAMVRAWRFANVAACYAASNPAWCRILREISCFTPVNVWTLFRCCVLGQSTLPFNASLNSGVNEYLIGPRWQCVRQVQSAEMAAGLCSTWSWNGARTNRTNKQGPGG